jgi:nucleotide-binding universal stress UspA family protein
MSRDRTHGALGDGKKESMKILCAVDGSRQSQWALDWLSRLWSPDDCSVMLVHAVDMTQFNALPKFDQKTRSGLVKVLEYSLEGAAGVLEWAELKAAKSCGQVRAKLLRGRPAEAIARVAKMEKVDVVVLGSRGVTEFQPMLLGSVSRKVLMRAPCPVLVVKKPATALKRIVLGADGSIESWEAAALLRTWSSAVRPQVTVATVVPPFPLESLRVPARAVAVGDQVEGTLRREAQKLAARVAGVLKQAGFPAKGVVLSGPPGAELVKLARRERANLVVVGSRSGRSTQEYFLGSVADAVAKYASCSVLIYRE